MFDLNDCINYLLTQAGLTVSQHFQESLVPYGLTPVQCGILNCLYKQDGLGIKVLCESMSINSSTMTGIIDRMEDAGLVERRPDPVDRRALVVYLTEKGWSFEAITEKMIIETNEFALRGFSQAKISALKEMLKDIAAKTKDAEPTQRVKNGRKAVKAG